MLVHPDSHLSSSSDLGPSTSTGPVSWSEKDGVAQCAATKEVWRKNVDEGMRDHNMSFVSTHVRTLETDALTKLTPSPVIVVEVSLASNYKSVVCLVRLLKFRKIENSPCPTFQIGDDRLNISVNAGRMP